MRCAWFWRVRLRCAIDGPSPTGDGRATLPDIPQLACRLISRSPDETGRSGVVALDGGWCRANARLRASRTKRWCHFCALGALGASSSTWDRPVEPVLFSFGIDRGKDGPHHRTSDRDLGQLDGDGACVTHNAGPDLDQLELEAGQRPVGHRLGQFDAAQQGGEAVGQRMQVQPHLVVAGRLARQPRRAEGVSAFLDVLLESCRRRGG